ncbi:hypothetical protein [uncultured Tateyamaria sp.]|uniref:hypothetical protein n=1 Tax=uncultured Tateyamaria sp. TaxID=455651 RepID=UPI00262A4396|nr:hypothetical protein [uncultured Tateyamaria sp.]
MTDHNTNTTLFLERRSYRRRRLMDALRLLPIVGLLLWLFPVFWPNAKDGPDAPASVSMSGAVTYVFLVWGVLILSASALWWGLSKRAGEGTEPPEQGR